MSAELTRPTILSIMHGDLAAIITDYLCGGYGAFKHLHVVAVNTNEGGGFDIGLELKPTPPSTEEQPK